MARKLLPRWLRPRFTSRVLLVITAVAALPCAWIAYERHQSHFESHISKQLEAHGCICGHMGRFFWPPRYDEPSDAPSFWRSEFSGLCGSRIKTVDLGRVATSSDLELLAPLTHLTVLQIHDSSLSKLDAIASLTTLKKLVIVNLENVSDISAVGNLQRLDELLIYRTQISDLSPIFNLVTLRCLAIIGQRSTLDLSSLASLLISAQGTCFVRFGSG